MWGCSECVAVGVCVCGCGCLGCVCVCVCAHSQVRGKECVRVPSNTHEKKQMGRIIKPEIKIPATRQIKTRYSPSR